MSIESISISNFMTKEVKTETGNQNIKAVCKTMYDSNIGSIVIVEKDDHDHIDKPIGIITERDIMRVIGSLNPPLLEVPISDIMSRPLITVSPKNTIKDALQNMQQKNIRRLVVVENETMIGIITDKDLFKAIINNQTLLPSLLHDSTLTGPMSAVHDKFGDWFSDVFHR